MRTAFSRALTRALLPLILISITSQPIAAAMLGTGVLIEGNADQLTLTEQQSLRGLVVEALEQRGVSSEQAWQRATSLSHQELALIQERIDNLPAGQGALEVLGIVFLVLLILELLGVTNVFSRF